MFNSGAKLKTYNNAFINLLKLENQTLSEDIALKEIIDLHQPILPELEDWASFKENMINHITSMTTFSLKLKNKQNLTVTPSILPDTSLMITYHKE